MKKSDLEKYSIVSIVFFLFSCVSTSKYESLKLEKEKNEEKNNIQLLEYSDKIKLLTEEIELLKEECQSDSSKTKKNSSKTNFEDDKIKKIQELKRKNEMGKKK